MHNVLTANVAYHLFNAAPLLAMLGIAVFQDVRTRRIRNWLTASIFLSGMARALVPGGPIGFGAAWAGVGVGVLLCIGLILIGALGGGDLKLVAAAGAWLGPIPIIAVFAVSAVVAMTMVIVHAFLRRRLGALAFNTLLLGSEIVRLRKVEEGQLTSAGETFNSVDRPLPFAVPMAIATLLVLIGVGICRQGIAS